MVDLFRQQNQALNRLGQTAEFAANQNQRATTNALAQDKFALQKQESELNQGIARDQNLRQEGQSYRAEGREQRAEKEATIESELQKLNIMGNLLGGVRDEETYNEAIKKHNQIFGETGNPIPPYNQKEVEKQKDMISNALGEVKKGRLLESERTFKKKMAEIKAQKVPSAAKLKRIQELHNQDFVARQSANGVQLQSNPVTGALGGTIEADQRAAFEADAKKSGYKAYFTEGESVDQPGLAWPPSSDNTKMLNVDLVKDPNFKVDSATTKPKAKADPEVDSFINKYLKAPGNNKGGTNEQAWDKVFNKDR